MYLFLTDGEKKGYLNHMKNKLIYIRFNFSLDTAPSLFVAKRRKTFQ